ncbi:ornithine cyclodeaminase [Cryobacterium sp. TMT1-21]|uniref:Ornithine cyclodeaminase n=1 Tax=Cryobacterium shii TaxID=1259235 RepID=A0AAQ2HGR5_9MICO|nr:MULTISPECIES: ornithine cyclodeaminase [Cryobacterium]TFC52214.1 ornithine cyclodeaminase [Cryobacterium shii]TFC88483.1 ornithine cyclodeaminase [Cryobacterium sp. TmT2-59]TFD15660.1 ornithine cyclodeaminase [Cryobacterium sp. TMT1-21]TFD18959.1 ornithine cyclodeaminase [Cryobacterium sp. TMT2-23]TFD20991.1 ornithine cyclodeaminase [Cryobacterium sp. TMT4-10]
MVRFVDVGNINRWAAETGVERILTDMVEYIERDFRRWPTFDKAPRVASHSPLGVIELMPTSDGVTYGFKYVNGHPSNPSRGLQTVTAFGVLADVQSGYPTFWSEMTVLTAFRTAATSAMVARALARPDSQTMAMIGTGTQSEFQALAFRGLLGINRLRVWDTDPDAIAKFVRNLAPLGFEIVVAASATDAVTGADIITTCTADKANATVLTDAMVGPGVHINAIGGDCPGKTELDGAILHRSDVFVEFTAQTRIEGEIQQMHPEFPVTEMWQVLLGQASGRTSVDQITVFDSVGFAIEDFSALRFLQDAVDQTRFYTDIDLVADPDDPKDLFGLVTAGAPVLV